MKFKCQRGKCLSVGIQAHGWPGYRMAGIWEKGVWIEGENGERTRVKWHLQEGEGRGWKLEG